MDNDKQRSGGQKLDQAAPNTGPVEVMQANCDQRRDGRSILRFKSEGFSVLGDEGGDVEERLAKAGAEIAYVAPALTRGGYVGTWVEPIMEIRYRLEGIDWYIYLATSSMGDTWQQEWWTSRARLEAHAAADAIEAARKLATY